jgi:acetyl esterase/lipase
LRLFLPKDIPYDNFSETNFDIFLPQTPDPAPLVIFFHGGGFVGGDKADVYDRQKEADEIRALLAKGIAFASVNYRLLQPGETVGVRKPLHDARRCLQFIRHHAPGFHIDKDRIGLYGASAGAGASLWIALNDDMADPVAADPVLRESTRVKAVAAFATQATYDLKKWETVVFRDYNIPLTTMIALAGGQRILGFYGIASAAEFDTPAIDAYRAEVDLLALISSDDPPIWLENRNGAAAAPADRNELFHHYKHAETLMERAAAAGVYHVVHLPAKPFKSADWKEVMDFFAEHLQ